MTTPSPTLAAATLAGPTLAANVMHFARLLRRAGLPVGPAETIAGQQALSLVDLGNRTEARTALRTAMIHRHEHQDVFDQAFTLFWRDPTAAEQAVAMALLEAQKEKKQDRAPPGSRRQTPTSPPGGARGAGPGSANRCPDPRRSSLPPRSGHSSR